MTAKSDKKELFIKESNFTSNNNNQNIYFSRVVNKISERGILTNKRILQLDQSQLKYYNYYKGFTDDSLVTGKFKQGINVIDIESESITSKKRNRILIEFEKRSLFDETSKQKLNMKDKEQIGKWELICNKQEQAEFIVQKIKEVKMNIRDEQITNKQRDLASRQHYKESQSIPNMFNTNTSSNEIKHNVQRSINEQQFNEEDAEDESDEGSGSENEIDLKQKIKNYENTSEDQYFTAQKRGNSPLRTNNNISMGVTQSQPSQKSSLHYIPQSDQSPSKKGSSLSNNQIVSLGNLKMQSIQQLNSIENDIQTNNKQNEVLKMNIEKIDYHQSSYFDSEEEKDIASPMLETKIKFQNKQSISQSLINILPVQQVQLVQQQSTPQAQEQQQQNNTPQQDFTDATHTLTQINTGSLPALRSPSSTQVSTNYEGSQATHRSLSKQNSMLSFNRSESSLGGSNFQRSRMSKQNTHIGVFSHYDGALKEKSEKLQLKRSAENSHEFRYHNFLEASLKGQNLEEQLKEGIKFFIYLGQFRQKAIEAAKLLVEDLMLPTNKAKFEPRFKSMTVIPEIEKSREEKFIQSTKSQSPSKKNQGSAREQQKSDPNKEPEEDDMFYLPEYNMIGRVFYTKQMNIFPTKLNNQIVFNPNEGVNYYDSSGQKYGGDQFRILKYISNSYLKIRKYDSSYSLRVPLSIMVDYLGFKVLIQARPQYEYNIVYGPLISDKDGVYQEYKKVQKYEAKIQEDASKLRQRLRIKPHYFAWKRDDPIECILTFETEIHKSAGDRSTKNNLVKYKKDTILIDQDKEEDQFYIEKFDDFFPINTFLDCQFDDNTMRFPRRLRPETLLKKKKHLNPEACFSQIRVESYQKENASNIKNYHNLVKLEKQDMIDLAEVEEYTTQISTTSLFKLIDDYDNLDVIPYDSHTIQESLHGHGLNIKYISHIAQHCKSPQVRILFEQEMVARTFKKIIRRYLAQLTFQSRKTGQQSVRRPNTTIMDSSSEGMYKQQQQQVATILQNTDTNQRKMVLEILNLMFEEGTSDCRQFWEQINTQILLEFDYPNQVYLAQFEKGGLLNAIHFNCPFILTYGLDLFTNKSSSQQKQENRFAQQILQQLDVVDENSIFEKKMTNPWDSKTSKKYYEPMTITNDKRVQEEEELEYFPQEILTLDNFYEFTCESKMFDYKDIPISIYSTLKIPSDPQKQVQSILIHDKISKSLNAEYKERFFTLYSIAKSYFMIGYYKECIEAANNCISCLDFSPFLLLVDPLCLLIKCYIILKEKLKVQYLFWKTEEIIDFNLGKMHPLHCSLLSIMAVYYESVGQYEEQIILLKASSNLIQKIVGTNHRRTAQTMFELANTMSEQGMIMQAIGYYENSFFIYSALKGDSNKKSADISYKLALETFSLRDLQKSQKYSTYCLTFYDGKEQIYINKIVDLKILQMKIMKSQQENSQAVVNSMTQIWLYMHMKNYKVIVHISELLKEYIECYLKTLTEKIKVFLSQQFEIILNRLIKINVLDSFQVVENQEKSKEIIMKEILDNKNDPYIFIERTFLTIAEDGQKNQPTTYISTSNLDIKDDDFDIDIRRNKSLFEHMMCLIGVSFFKTTFLQNLI